MSTNPAECRNQTPLQSLHDLRLTTAPVVTEPFDLTLFQPVVFGDRISVLAGVNKPFIKPTWPAVIARTAAEWKKCCRLLMNKDVLALDKETSVATSKKLEAEQKGVEVSGDRSEQWNWTQIGVPEQRRVPVAVGEGILPGVKVDLSKPGKAILFCLKSLDAEEREKSLQTGQDSQGLRPYVELAHRDPPILFIIQYARFERGQGAKIGVEYQHVDDIYELARWFYPEFLCYNLSALSYLIRGEPISKEGQSADFDVVELDDFLKEYMVLDVEQPSKIWGTILENVFSAVKEAEEILASQDEEQIAFSIRDCIKDRYNLTRNGIDEKLLEFEAEALAYDNYLKKTLLPVEYAKLKEELGERFIPTEGFVCETPFGSASFRASNSTSVDLSKLEALDPSLPGDVVRQKTSKDAIALAKKSLASAGRKYPAMDKIWAEIRDTVASGETKLLMNLIDLPVEPDVKAAAAAVVVPDGTSVSDCLKRIVECRVSALKLQLEANVINERARLALKRNLLEEGLLILLREKHTDPEMLGFRQTLSDGSEIGFSHKVVKAVNFTRFHSLYPELYEFSGTVWSETTKQSVKDALKERGFDGEQIEAVMKEVCVPTGKLGRARAYRSPHYAVYYRGYKKEPSEDLRETLESNDAGESQEGDE